MEIRGSGNKYYTVNLENLTCTCKDWSCRRHNFPKGDDRRLCKHIIEAIDILNSSYLMKEDRRLSNPIPVDRSFIGQILQNLSNSDIISRYFIGGEYSRGSNYITKCLPIVIMKTYRSIRNEFIDEIFSDFILDKSISGDEYRFYNGIIPIKVIVSNDKNFLYKEIYSRLTIEEIMRLSSTSYSILGLKLTDKGFLNKKNEIIDMNVSTEEELCELLGIKDITEI